MKAKVKVKMTMYIDIEQIGLNTEEVFEVAVAGALDALQEQYDASINGSIDGFARIDD